MFDDPNNINEDSNSEEYTPETFNNEEPVTPPEENTDYGYAGVNYEAATEQVDDVPAQEENTDYGYTGVNYEAAAEPVNEAPAQAAEENTGYYGEAPQADDTPRSDAEPVYTGYTPAGEEIPHAQTERVQPNPAVNPYSSQYRQSYQQFSPPYQGEYYRPQEVPPEKKSGKKGIKVLLAVIALILVFALGVGTAGIFKDKGLIKGSDSDDIKTTHDTAELEIADTPSAQKSKKTSGSALTPAEIAEKVRESNVGIVVYTNSSSSKKAGEGSGVVMGKDSTGEYTYIITCAHVIDTAGIKVSVQTDSGETFDAEIVGFDVRTDLGVVKVKATNLKAAEFGNSDEISIGDPVYAVGNPGGVEFFGSFTGGYVSAINRPVSSEIGYTMKCIQHDASINPGNSGGMLVNQYGQVIGINSQKIASTEYEGMGFAIPISSAKEVIDSLIQYSYVPNRPKLGITYYPVSASMQYYIVAQARGLPAGTLIINEISPDSSLANSEVRQYDMIVSVNGKQLTTADVLLELIDNGKVGDKLKLGICRVGNNYTVSEFEVEAVLVEDKGDSIATTTQQAINPFDYFNNFGNGNYFGN
jgi:serine protease Do